jgi:MOSC domain-containing protein YiiM
MKLASVNVGLPREVNSRERKVRTSIWKTAVEGRVRVNRLNLEGASSPTSPCTAVRRRLYTSTLSSTMNTGVESFQGWISRGERSGENFTTEGLLERDVRIGNGLRVDSAEFLVTQPRMPCYKLGVRFGRDDMVKRFLGSGRTGFYLTVFREGAVARGDSIEFTRRSDHDVTVADIGTLYTHDADNQSLLRRAAELPALPDSWRDYFRKRLWEPDA